jgi:hypothetical protein
MIYQRSVIPDIQLATGAAWVVRQLPVNLPGRNYKVEFETNIIQGATIGTATLQFQNVTGLGVPGYWSITQGWSVRATLIDVFQGLESNEIGIIGSNDAQPAGISWSKLRVFDVGPV